MDSGSLVTIAGTAFLTAVLALIPLRASRLHAVTDTSGADSKIEQPKAVAGGVEVTLTCLDKELCRQGKEPVFVLKAVNTNAGATSVAFDASMTDERMASRVSRTLSRPGTIWQTRQTLSLEPHQIKELQLKGTMLPENSSVSVNLRLQHKYESSGLSFSIREEPGGSVTGR
jgi:hypothetical protein